MATLGSGQFTIYVSNDQPDRKNLLNPNTWSAIAPMVTSPTGFSLSQSTSNENAIVEGLDPFGRTNLLWECRPASDGNSGGGFTTDYFKLDSTKKYRFVVFFKINNISTSGALILIGAYDTVQSLAGVDNTNPYFYASLPPVINRWYMAVSYIHGSGTAVSSSEGGIYDCTTGTKVSTPVDYKWKIGTGQAKFRIWNYYETNTAVRQWMWSPAVELCDGTEPTLETLLNAGKISDNKLLDIATDSKITPQEKPAIMSRWREIYDFVGDCTATMPTNTTDTVNGEFKSIRAAAVSAGTWTPTTPATAAKAYYDATEALRAYLFTTPGTTQNPGILINLTWLNTTFDITKATYLTLWTTYRATAEAMSTASVLPISWHPTWSIVDGKPAGASILVETDPPSGVGLAATATKLGFYNGSTWPILLENYGPGVGTFYAGTGGLTASDKYIKWDGTGAGSLTVRGTIYATAGTIGGINLVSNKLYVGTGTYNNPLTSFYLDDTGQFSLKDKLVWDGSNLSINGSGTFTGNLSIGSGDTIFKTSAGDLWAGNATFADAPFSVTKAGLLKATSGSIGTGTDGWNITATGITAKSANSVIQTSSVASTGIKITNAEIAGYGSTVKRFSLSTAGSGFLGGSDTAPVLSWTAGGVVTLAGWTVDTTSISKNNISLNSSSGYLKIGNLASVTDTAGATSGFWADNSGNALLKGTATNYIKVTASGVIDISSTSFSLRATTAGSIGLGASSYAADSGVWLSNAAGTKFRVGTDSTHSCMRWDDTNLEIYNSAGVKITSFGGTNLISGWSVDETKFYKGTSGEIIGLVATTGANKSIFTGATSSTGASAKTYFNADGSGALASDNIKWDASGNVVFGPTVSLSWKNASLKKGTDLLLDTWATGTNVTTLNSKIISYGAANNDIIVETTPFGYTDYMWKCKYASGTGWISGMASAALTSVSTASSYRFTFWMKTEGTRGTFYLGHHGTIAGDSNYYFTNLNLSLLSPNINGGGGENLLNPSGWYFVELWVKGNTSTATISSKIYRINGSVFTTPNTPVSLVGETSRRLRLGWYNPDGIGYGTGSSDDYIYIYDPRCYVDLGEYPSVAEMMAGTTYISGNQISTGYIKSTNFAASIGTGIDLDNEVIRMGGSNAGYDTSGIFIGKDSSAYKLSLKAATGSGSLTWDGAGVLNITGAITATSGTFGAATATNKWIIGANTTYASIYNGKSSLLAAENGIYIGTDGISIGLDTSGPVSVPKFKVAADGTLTAIDGIFSGTLNSSLLKQSISTSNSVNWSASAPYSGADLFNLFSFLPIGKSVNATGSLGGATVSSVYKSSYYQLTIYVTGGMRWISTLDTNISNPLYYGTIVVTPITSDVITVHGDLIVMGKTTALNTTVEYMTNPIIVLGGSTAPTVDDNRDRGVKFRWYSGGAKTGFFGFDDSSGKFTFIPDATDTSGVFSGALGTVAVSSVEAATADFTGAVGVGGALTVTGNFTVNGTTTTINATTITVDDKNIELGSVASPDNTTANGGGITLKGFTDKTINWYSVDGNWTSSEDWNLVTGKVFKINNVSILSATALGSSVVGSSLTSLGTLASNLLFTDNMYDIGASGVTRPRTIYTGTSIITPIIKLSGSSDQVIFQSGGVTGTLTWTPATTNKVVTIPNRTLTIDNITTSTTSNGTGFVKANGSVISFDNSTYLTSVGTGVANELTYWSGTNTLGSLATATYPTLTEISYSKGLTSSAQTQINGKNSYHGVVARPVGASNPLPTTITTTTFTLGATANPISYYYMGVLVSVTSNKTATLDDGLGGSAAGLYYVYFNAATGNILATKTFPGIDASSNVIIAIVFWNGTNLGLVSDERHSYNRNKAWHMWAHNTVGCRYKSGITLTHNSGTGAAATFSTTSGEIDDEDIQFTVNASSAFPTPNAGRLMYQSGASTYSFVAATSTKPGYLGANNRPNYVNATGFVLTEMNSAVNRYINVFVYATTDLHTPIYFLTETISSATAGTNGYTSIADARIVPFPNLSGFGVSPEFKPIYRIIWRADGELQAINTVSDDYRTVTSLPMSAGNVTTTASAVTFNPSGTIAASTVQTAIEELGLDKLALAGGTMTGNLLFTDNTLDIGASGATRPRTVYVGTSVVSPLFTGAINGTVGATTPSTGVFTSIKSPKHTIDRVSNPTSGYNFYSETINSWQIYMAPGSNANQGYNGNLTATPGTYVTTWSMRFNVEPVVGYGWIWETLPSTTTGATTVVAELASVTGNFKTIGTLESSNISALKTIAESWIGPSATNGVYFKGGLVGIGTNSPAVKLDVTGTIYASSGIRPANLYIQNSDIFQWATDANAEIRVNHTGYGGGTTQFRDFGIYNGKSTSVLFVDGSAGNVGIGTTAPLGIVHTVTSTYPTTPLLERNGLTSDSSWGLLRVLATKTTSMNDGFGGSITFNIQDDTGVENLLGAIGATRAGADNTGDLVFQTSTAGSNTEKMRITSAGNVGLGVTNPTYILDIQRSTAEAQIKATTGTNYSMLRFTNTGGSFFVGRNDSVGTALVTTGGLAYSGVLNAQGTYPLQFAVNNTVGMTLINGGNVGIGTAVPSSKLDIRGAVVSVYSVVAAGVGNGAVLLLGGETGLTTTPYHFGQIQGSQDIAGRYAGNLRFFTTSNGTDGEAYSGSYERMRINARGNVGIGTTSSNIIGVSESNRFLDIRTPTAGYNGQIQLGTIGTSASTTDTLGQVQFYGMNGTAGAVARSTISTVLDGATNSTKLTFDVMNAGSLGTVVTIKSSGNVGIGTTNPSKLLHIKNSAVSATPTQLLLETDADGATGIQFKNTDFSTNLFQLFLSNDGKGLKIGRDNVADYLTINDGGNVGIGTTSPFTLLHLSSASETAITLTNTLTTSDGSHNVIIGAYKPTVGFDNLIFNAASYSFKTIGTTEKLTILTGGNVGIGTVAPTQKLQISSADTSATYVQITNSTTGITATDGFIVGVDTNGNATVWNREATSLRIGTNGTEKITVLSDGKVGVGTTSPSEQLSVVGNLAFGATEGKCKITYNATEQSIDFIIN